MQINEVLNVGSLGGLTDDNLAVFSYSNAITGTANTASTATLQTGGTVAGGGLDEGAAVPGTLFIDADRLRLRFSAAVGILETKINEIISRGKISC